MLSDTTRVVILLGAIGATVACSPEARAEVAYGVTENQTLIRFDTSDPSAVLGGSARAPCAIRFQRR